MSNPNRKQWNKPYLPIRNLILWGWDNNHNPSFLVLYGEHQYETTSSPAATSTISSDKTGFLGSLFKSLFSSSATQNPDPPKAIIPTQSSFLDEQVTYTHYAIFKGHEGHLPSFEALKILTENEQKKMYYKKGVSYDWRYHTDANSLVESFKPLEAPTTFTYFNPPPYEYYVVQLEKQGLVFSNFTLAKHPNDFLKLSGDTFKYYSEMSQILSHPLLYMRKKYLNALLDQNPPAELLQLLFKIGSSELISGLCLELAKRKNPILIEETKELLKNPINFESTSYSQGVLRCANIYVHTLDPKLKQPRLQTIYKMLPDADLHLINIQGKPVAEGKRFSGAQYHTFANQGVFKKDYWTYDRELRTSIKRTYPAFYKVGPYTDGYDLNILAFKNTLQEAISYDLADVVGKLAYYLDAPRLRYYFKGSGKTKAYNYLIGSVRRTLDDYAKNQPDLFIAAMKSLLPSYTCDDYLCRFPGNFQFNYFIRRYLYHDFTEKPPTNWRNRYSWFSEDQLMKLNGRYEMMKELWDQHLEDVLYIASHAQIPSIQKACYYIIKESPTTTELVTTLSHQQLILLSQSAFLPLAELFMQYLNERLNACTTCEPKLLLALMDTSNEKIKALALQYISQINGSFSPLLLTECILLEHADGWLETLQGELMALDMNQYADFIVALTEKLITFKDETPKLTSELEELLMLSAHKLESLSFEKASYVMMHIRNVLSQVPKLSSSFLNYFECLLFSFNEDTLEVLLKGDGNLETALPVAQRQKHLLALLTAIKEQTLPSDAAFKLILEEGNPPMIKTLLTLLEKLQSTLPQRPTLLLLMLESDVVVLNDLATSVFEALPQEASVLPHQLIIDSPLPKVYNYGLLNLDKLYGDFIPKTFILQLLEHPSSEVKAYISHKIDAILEDLSTENAETFMYYVKTLLLLPNKISKSKDIIYKLLPSFVLQNPSFKEVVEAELLAIGGSNIKRDSERALMSLAQIRKEFSAYES